MVPWSFHATPWRPGGPWLTAVLMVTVTHPRSMALFTRLKMGETQPQYYGVDPGGK